MRTRADVLFGVFAGITLLLVLAAAAAQGVVWLLGG